MIKINDALFFSQGTTRQCFIHPNDRNLCIKIALTDQGSRTPGIIKAINRENQFYQKLQKRNINWLHLSQYYGDIETNLGIGSTYQIIRDYNGEISKSLESYLESGHFSESNHDILNKKLEKLYLYLQQNKILTTSLLPRNIVVQQFIDDFELVIIDDIGNSEFIAISEYFAMFASKKIHRKWQRFLKLLLVKYSIKV